MNIMRVEDTQGIQPGYLMECAYGLAAIYRVGYDHRGIVTGLSARLLEATADGLQWIGVDLDIAENLKFYTVH